MRLSPVENAVIAVIIAAIGTLAVVAVADNGDQPQPPRQNVADARIAALERQVAQQDQTLVLMRLMLGQVRQDLEEVRKHQKPTGLRYTDGTNQEAVRACRGSAGTG